MERLAVVEAANPIERASRRRIATRAALGLALVLGIPVAGQSPFQQFPSSNSGRLPQQYPPDTNAPFGQDSNSPERKRVQLLNSERQKALVSDTEKLLKLAKELNDDIAASTSGAMSENDVRKVTEIGKLAKNVKEKMSYSVIGLPGSNTPLTIPPGVQ